MITKDHQQVDMITKSYQKLIYHSLSVHGLVKRSRVLQKKLEHPVRIPDPESAPERNLDDSVE
jgi:hypothetical protein